MKDKLDILYKKLRQEFGELNWWPIDKTYHKTNNCDPRFEIIVGAILTQNTAWTNVEKALLNLKSKNVLNIENISSINISKLEKLIRPSGFFKQKAKRLINITNHFKFKYKSNLDEFFSRDITEMRE